MARRFPAEQGQGIASVVTEAVGATTTRQMANSTVLWVDDRPNNNVYERMALEALGIRFVISTSTDGAVEKLRSGRYDLVISDMGRPPDSLAGYTLLSRVRDELKLKTPISSMLARTIQRTMQRREEGRKRQHRQPRDLFRRVVGSGTGQLRAQDGRPHRIVCLRTPARAKSKAHEQELSDEYGGRTAANTI